CASKWLWHLQLVPTAQRPEFLTFDHERQNRIACFLSQKNRSHFHLVSRASRAVDGKCSGKPFFHHSDHSYEAADSAAAGRTFYNSETKPLDAACSIFAVKALRGKHDYLSIAEKVCAGKNAIVPEGIDRQSPIRFDSFEILYADRFKSERQTKGADR